MARIKKLSAKRSRRTDRRRSQREASAVGRPRSGISSRRPRLKQRRAARRRMDEGEVVEQPARLGGIVGAPSDAGLAAAPGYRNGAVTSPRT